MLKIIIKETDKNKWIVQNPKSEFTYENNSPFSALSKFCVAYGINHKMPLTKPYSKFEQYEIERIAANNWKAISIAGYAFGTNPVEAFYQLLIGESLTPIVTATKQEKTEMSEIIKQMVNRFLIWKLPADFAPDGGISFNRIEASQPVGTNLFTATQAESMIVHMIAHIPILTINDANERIAELKRDLKTLQDEIECHDDEIFQWEEQCGKDQAEIKRLKTERDTYANQIAQKKQSDEIFAKLQVLTENELICAGVEKLIKLAHDASRAGGWYSNPDGSEKVRNVPEMLCLIHSEISEAMEGYRKSLPDDKLPHRPMIEVELADAAIRIGDLAGYLKLDVGGAIIEKMEFNKNRADHKLENRNKTGGKAF